MTARSRISILSRLLFLWIVPVIRTSATSHLTDSSLPDLPSNCATEHDIDRFDQAVRRYRRGLHTPLIRPLIRAYWGPLLKIFLLSNVVLGVSLLAPILLRELLVGLKQDTVPPLWLSNLAIQLLGYTPTNCYAVACAVLIGINAVVNIFAIHHLFFVQPVLSFRMRSTLNHAIFTKALRQDRASHQQLSTGLIINLIGTDTHKIGLFTQFMHSIYYHPVSLILVMVVLYKLIGIPALIGASSLAALLFTSIVISRIQGHLRKQLSALADARVGLTRETLLHIKAAKLQGWEDNLSAKIQSFRESEATLGRRLTRLTALLLFVSNTAPAIAMAITAVLIIRGGGSLDATIIFPMLSLFMMLRFSMSTLPEMLYNMVEAAVSMRRIRAFIDTPDFSPPAIHSELQHAISCEGLKVSWPDGSPACDVPKLDISRGELVVIVGSVGAGKSALLLSILGEIPPASGSITIGGSLGYVPQNPWIVSDTIRNNILAGAPFEPHRYRRAIRASGLALDLNALPHGDSTQIGERGINLSGGQRHRVALARTYYNAADIYLFDDPLSALDPNVANHVFTTLICNELSLSTRIVVTHRVEFALAADRILVVEDGRIVEQGPPSELRISGTRFAELLEFHEKTNRETAQAISRAPSTPTEQENTLDEAEDALEADSIIVSEERQRGAVSRSIAMEYLASMASFAVLVGILVLFIGRQLAATATDLWLARSAQATALNPTTFIVVYLCCILLLCGLAYSRAICMFSCAFSAGVRAHERLLRGVLRAPMRFFESHPVGRLLNRFSRDLDTVENALPRNIFDSTHCLCETLAVCVVVTVVAPITLVVVIPAAALYYVMYRRYRPAARELQRLFSVNLSPIFAIFSESLAGLETLRVSRLTGAFTSRFCAALNAHTRVAYAQVGTNRWLGVRLELLGASVLTAVALVSALGWDLTAGVAFSGLALTYANAMMGSMNWAIRSLSMAESSLTSFERMERYAQTEPEALAGTPPPPEWPTSGAITISELSVRYRPELPPALHGVSCSIPAGSRVGIVGRSGSGKSTLILAFMRLLEAYDGYIEIDGVKLSSLPLVALRQSVAVVPQEPVLFSGTLRESLDPFYQFSDAEIESALGHVELAGFVGALPEKLATRVREGGFNFSTGQRQLICLARALLRKSKVIILDEATAAIDVETDHAIQRAIRKEFQGSTILVVAHRLGTIVDSDYILSLRQGQLIEFGSPQELLTQPNSILSQFMRDMHTTPGYESDGNRSSSLSANQTTPTV